MIQDNKNFETFNNNARLLKPQNQILSDINQIFKEDAFDMERFYQQYEKVQAPARKQSPINVRTFGPKMQNPPNTSLAAEEGFSNLELPNESVYVPVDDSEMIDLSVIRPDHKFVRNTGLVNPFKDKETYNDIGSNNMLYNESLYVPNNQPSYESNVHETSNILEQLDRFQLQSHHDKKLNPPEEEMNWPQANRNNKEFEIRNQHKAPAEPVSKPADEFERFNNRPIEQKLNPHDDKPIATTKKTFEQLLQEELQKQNSQPNTQPYEIENNIPEDLGNENQIAKPKREFLKKNQGKKIVNVNPRDQSVPNKQPAPNSRENSVSKPKPSISHKPSTYALQGKQSTTNAKSQSQLKQNKSNPRIEQDDSEDMEPEFDIEAKKKNVKSLMSEINEIFNMGSNAEGREENDYNSTPMNNYNQHAQANSDEDADEWHNENRDNIDRLTDKMNNRYNVYNKSAKEVAHPTDMNSLNEFYEIEKQNYLNYNLNNYLHEDNAHQANQKKEDDSKYRSHGKQSEGEAKNIDRTVMKMNDLIDGYNDEDKEEDEMFNQAQKKRFNDNERWNHNKDDEENFESSDEKVQKRNPVQPSNEQKPSKIVEKYFGGSNKPKPNAPSIPKTEMDSLKVEIENKLNEKIAELQNEINNYKIRNDKLKIEKFKVDEKQKHLDKQIEQFEAQKQEELRQIEEFREEEFKKVRREKQITMRNIKAMENKPNRKEREEIENLKEQLKKSEEEHLIKERKLKATIERQKKKLEECIEEIEDLRSQIKIYENMRINDGLKNHKDANTAIKNPANKNQVPDNSKATEANLASQKVINESVQKGLPDYRTNKVSTDTNPKNVRGIFIRNKPNQ